MRLINAAIEGNTEEVRKLLTKGVNVDTVDKVSLPIQVNYILLCILHLTLMTDWVILS